MPFIISSKGADLTPAIKSFAEEKTKRFNKYEDNITQTIVELQVSFLKEGKLKSCTVEIILQIPKAILKIKETDEDMYKAIDKAVDRMEEELRRHKEKCDERNQRGLSYAPRRLAKLLTGWIKK